MGYEKKEKRKKKKGVELLNGFKCNFPLRYSDPHVATYSNTIQSAKQHPISWYIVSPLSILPQSPHSLEPHGNWALADPG